MQKNKKIGCISLLLFSPLTMAMQPLDDQTLAKATAQDGLNVGINVSKIDFNQLALINSNNTTYANKSALVMAASPGAASSAIGVDFVRTFNADGTILGNSSQLLQAVIDTDAGKMSTGGAFANIAVTLGSDVNGMRIRPLSVYLVPDNVDAISSLTPTYTQKSIFSSGTTLKSNIKELLRTDNIDIKFVAVNKPTMNIQLGASPQGHMVVFGGAIDSICGATALNPDGCSINLVSGTTGAKFKLQMTGMGTSGFSLNGFHAGIENEATNGTVTVPGGFVFGNFDRACATDSTKCLTSDKFNLSLNNVQLGELGNTNTDVFNGLPNGSMGNWGIKGASITDFKMKVSGL
ncbi:pilus assembly protein FilA [Acinetobacter sp. VNH17]|mgnify:CR=1 FL=1|uniref:Pilus assembly protein FilA n=2 Tax=Acinetobacter TaxID=469 RepID=A0ABT7WMG4_9GAMM|nr:MULTISPECIES: pilus assembly protein FilA [Acinetobacter]MCY6411768.1 pilus assembly protein FilA [Acinetobacter thutiue]MDN0013870.1 pilus assembly protein FilA [Acinetobacter thutiue]WHP05290.1 pilus assembly protein FilA [Acinetobacter sp. KCTC 92772]